MNIYEKLTNLQFELKAPKGQFNSFGKYKYRSCEDIVESVKPLLLKHKLNLTIQDDLIQQGDRYYVKAIATLTDIEKTESKIIINAFAREEESKKGMDGSQVTGASSSYARKYALNGLFGIDDTKDSDGTNEHDKTDIKPPVKSAKPINKSSTAQDTVQEDSSLVSINEIMELEQTLTNHKRNIKDVLEKFKIKSIQELKVSQFKWLMGQLK